MYLKFLTHFEKQYTLITSKARVMQINTSLQINKSDQALIQEQKLIRTLTQKE